MSFPYGHAALAILLLAVASGLAIFIADVRRAIADKPDLTFVTFVREHADSYKQAVKEFEETRGVKVQIQLVSQRALQGRLQSALQVGADVPDMVELLTGSLGYFARGPIEDVGFIDITDRIAAGNWKEKLVESRFSMWTSRGHIFALPHDVHPVMLAYRRDLVEQLDIDVSTLKTWDDFVRVGRDITRDHDGDGVIDHYMIDLPADGGDALRLLIQQRDVDLFDADGNVSFDDERVVEVVCWYVRQTTGPTRISFAAGWGQNLARTMIDGLCLFYFTPDWRTKQFENDVPSLSGKMALMPLPAWSPGERRTSTWGGTGLAITKASRNPELAWDLAMFLYYERSKLGERFADTNIIPPLRSAWDLPEFDAPNAFYSNQAVGRLMAELAPSVPETYSSPYTSLANGKLSEAYNNAVLYYRKHGEDGFVDYVRRELKRCADRTRQIVERNQFYNSAEAAR